MNNLYKTLALASALAAATTTTSVSAFAPATQQKIAFSPSPSQSKQRLSNMEPLHMANSGKNTPTEDDLKEQAQKATQFLALNLEQTENQLAKNWKWITASGVVTLALGTGAFLSPVFSTGVAYDVTVASIAAIGVGGLANVFIAEKGHKLKSGLSGLGYSGLAYYMATHPAQGLDVITLTIATVILAEGLYETALAARNENLQGRGWHFTSGIISAIAGLWLSASIPAASLVAPGAALGTRLTSNGASKLAIGLTGKEIAKEKGL
jgi:uncharacterized membrane protein HdeD (DUF308 family)